MIKRATTVILYYEKTGKKYVLLTKRKKELFFLGGFHVYPGGKVDETDFDKELIERIPNNIIESLVKDSGINDPGIVGAHYIAGVREVFEEVGLRLFSSPFKELNWKKLREKLILSEFDFNSFVKEYKITFSSEFSYFNHFVTPDIYPVRFDTIFFLYKLGGEMKVDINTNEIESYMWVTPEEALKLNEKFEIYIIPPTKITLNNLIALQ